MRPVRFVAWLALALAAMLGSSACDRGLRTAPLPNQLPIVRITQAPRDTNAVCRFDPTESCYRLDLAWSGFDVDGRVERFEYAIDPPSAAGADTAWVRTRANQQAITFSNRDEAASPPGGPAIARQHHVFVVRAVDDRGAVGPPDFRAFFSYTEAPTVSLEEPRPNQFTSAQLAPVVWITWRGEDRDGIDHDRPVRYKYFLFHPSSEITAAQVIQDPGRIRARYAPDFEGWNTVGGDTTSVLLNDLVNDHEYVFAVVAFDEAGAYSPVFSFTSNLLRFRVSRQGTLGPQIQVSSDLFAYQWRGGGYCATCPPAFTFELPIERSLLVLFSARAASGASVRSYRWAIDIPDLTDETRRTDELTDVRRWSARSSQPVAIRLGPYTTNSGTSEDHLLVLEAEDNRGLKSLATVRFRVVPPQFQPGSMLVVKDTRLKPDQLDRATQCSGRPTGFWPTQAELDTFLFARGNMTWRCYPTGTRSTPGLFAGWAFDTLGTRLRQSDLTVPLSTLSRYEHVVWIIDQKSAGNVADGNDFFAPQTALRYISDGIHFNSLSAYLRFGGKVWLLGGGGGWASTPNDPSNDQPTVVLSNATRELRPTRLMYDFAGWRSEFRLTSVPITIRRFTGRHEQGPDPALPYTAHLAELPATIQFRVRGSPADPMPPNRTNQSDFYQSVASIEFLQYPNPVREPLGPDSSLVSTLDTLYEGSAGGLPIPGPDVHNVMMTYYHGANAPQGFLFSGFDVWTYRRADCQGLVDFVLRRIWNVRRRTGATHAPALAPAGPPAAGGRGDRRVTRMREPR